MNKKRLISIGIIAALFLIGAFMFGQKSFSMPFTSKEKQKTTTIADNKISVKVVQPKSLQLGEGASFKATLEASEEGIVSPKNGGKVVQILFEDGKKVSRDEPLVVLDDRDIKNQLKSAVSQLAVTRANLQKLQASQENTLRTYERMQTLLQKGGATQAELENIEASLKMINADIASAEAGVQAAQATIDTLGTSLADTVIRASISGIMDGKNVNLGQFVAQGAVLGRVKDITQINAVIEVDQALIGNITEGQKAQVRLSEASSTPFEGVVKSINMSADPSSRVFKVKIQVDNQNMILKSGVFAKVSLAGDQKTPALLLPVETLGGKEGSYFVFVNDSGVAKKRIVTIGGATGNMVEIKSGLQGNDAVIGTNLNMLQEGDKITVVTE